MIGNRRLQLFQSLEKCAAVLLLTGLLGTTRAGDPVPLTLSNLTVQVEQGRGELDAAGSYTIRVYRRVPGVEGLEFAGGVMRPRDGAIERTWLRDLDADGEPEVLVWIISASESRYGTLDVFRITPKGLSSRKLHGLSSDEDKGYAGRDLYRVTRDGVEREFPIYRTINGELVESGQRRLLRYTMVEGRWRKAGEEILGEPVSKP